MAHLGVLVTVQSMALNENWARYLSGLVIPSVSNPDCPFNTGMPQIHMRAGQGKKNKVKSSFPFIYLLQFSKYVTDC